VTVALPELVPVLSKGRHRNPRRGACFMELASYLAGERWSDHPRCTHPLLSAAARLVNDHTSDDARQELTVLVPSVIGLRSDDPRWDVLIARRAALFALPIASSARQRALAVGVLAAERMLAKLDGRAIDDLTPEGRAALDAVAPAYRWAQDFSSANIIPMPRFSGIAAPSIVRTAVIGVAEACVKRPDTALGELLRALIGEAQALAASDPDSRADLRPALAADQREHPVVSAV
jgi:hypothetical protein